MALEMLRGPIPFRYGNDGCMPTDEFFYWIDGIGLVGHWRPYNCSCDVYGVAQLDGTVSARAFHNSMGYSAYSFGFDFDTGYLIGRYGFGEIMRTEPRTGAAVSKLVNGLNNTLYSRIAGRLVRLQNGTLYARSMDLEPEVEEFTFIDDPVTYRGDGCISASGKKGVVWVCFRSGDIFLYDAINKAVMGRPTGIAEGNEGMWYSPALDVFISAHKTHGTQGDELALCVWANEPRPHSMIAPEPVGTLIDGTVTRLRTRVLGSYGEPCGGHVVSWSLTGPGALSSVTSVTDADGYASAEYIAPLADGGQIAVHASLEF